jgi:N-acetylglucosamine malate deacetylase 2
VASPQAATRLDLFLLAHHDDEVFCAGRLRRALAGGGRVHLLWATAGGLAPARRRVAEGVRVLETLGLPGHAGSDLHLADQHAVEHVAAIAAAVALIVDGASPPDASAGDAARDEVGAARATGEDAQAARATGEDAQATATTVYVPAYEGGHPDHDAVNLAAARAAASRPGLRVVEFPLYRRGPFGLTVASPLPPAATAREPLSTLPLDEGDLALRSLLARANASQLAPSLLPLLSVARLAGRGRAEPARPLPAHDYTRPPHPGRLLYELYTPWRFARWSAAAAASSVSPAL